jgi:hypothetical protein
MCSVNCHTNLGGRQGGEGNQLIQTTEIPGPKASASAKLLSVDERSASLKGLGEIRIR